MLKFTRSNFKSYFNIKHSYFHFEFNLTMTNKHSFVFYNILRHNTLHKCVGDVLGQKRTHCRAHNSSETKILRSKTLRTFFTSCVYTLFHHRTKELCILLGQSHGSQSYLLFVQFSHDFFLGFEFSSGESMWTRPYFVISEYAG